MLGRLLLCGSVGESEGSVVKAVQRVPGLAVVKNVLSEAEEAALLQAIDEDAREFTVRRTRVTKNYGPFFSYNKSSKVARGVGYTAVPKWACLWLERRVKERFGYAWIPEAWRVNQVHVALYRVNEHHKIRMHNDCTMGELAHAVVGVSLGDTAQMTFENRGRGRGASARVNVKLPRRSAYAMTGDALRVWRHGILAGQTAGNRVSITMRHVVRLYVGGAPAPETPISETPDNDQRHAEHPEQMRTVSEDTPSVYSSSTGTLIGSVAAGIRLRDEVSTKIEQSEVEQVITLHGLRDE